MKGLRREAVQLKEVVAELTLENRLLKKSMVGNLGILTPADVYFGRGQIILLEREKKRQSIEQRRLQYRKIAA